MSTIMISRLVCVIIVSAVIVSEARKQFFINKKAALPLGAAWLFFMLYIALVTISER